MQTIMEDQVIELKLGFYGAMVRERVYGPYTSRGAAEAGLQTQQLNALAEDVAGVCDVEGCDDDVSSQGRAWNDSGYWCVCGKHAAQARNGDERPVMKGVAIYREELRTRHPKGFLPHNSNELIGLWLEEHKGDL